MNPRSANKRLEGVYTTQLYAYCKEHGLDLNKTPAWQRLGILLYREGYSKRGYDPIRKIDVVVQRKRVKTDYNIPLFRTAEGKAFLKRILQQASTALASPSTRVES